MASAIATSGSASVEPDPAPEEERVRCRDASSRHQGQRHRYPRSEHRAGDPERRASNQRSGRRFQPRGSTQRASRQHVIHHRRVDGRTGHLAGHRDREQIRQRGSGGADDDDLVLERRGFDERLLPSEDLLLRVEQVVERQTPIERLAVGHDRACVPQQRTPRRAVLAVVARDFGFLQGKKAIAQPDTVAIQPHLVRPDIERNEGSGHPKRRHPLLPRADERDVPAERTVGIEHDEVVPDGAARFRNRRDRRRDDRPIFDGRVQMERSAR